MSLTAVMLRSLQKARLYVGNSVGELLMFEKEDDFVGGLSTSEIPGYRLPYAHVYWEVELAKDLGVKVAHGKELGKDGLSVDSLRAGGAQAVLLATGLPEPMRDACFDDLGPEHGFWTSKSFLPKVAAGSKPGMCATSGCKLPKLSGNVVVLGAGDTAFDCATSALRCGADRVPPRGVLALRARGHAGGFDLPIIVTNSTLVTPDLPSKRISIQSMNV